MKRFADQRQKNYATHFNDLALCGQFTPAHFIPRMAAGIRFMRCSVNNFGYGNDYAAGNQSRYKETPKG
jgi:hypothetical protein